MKTCVCFITHSFSPELRRRFETLRRQAPAGADVRILAEKGSEVPPELLPITTFFEFARLRERPAKVIGDRLVPGNVHLAFLHFRDVEPGYDEYWFIEYDVLFSGDWRTLFDAVTGDRADLIAGEIRSETEVPGWYWWRTLDFPGRAPGPRVRGFFPMCRISGRALDAVARRVKDRWTGHHEGLIPTALLDAGLTLSDVGGEGSWTPAERRGRFYVGVSTDECEMLLGTYRCAPPHFGPRLIPDQIYHPVKERLAPNLGDLRKMRQRARLLLSPRLAAAWLGAYWRALTRKA